MPAHCDGTVKVSITCWLYVRKYGNMNRHLQIVSQRICSLLYSNKFDGNLYRKGRYRSDVNLPVKHFWG